MIRKINQFYDSIPEPFRLIFGLVLSMPGIVLAVQENSTLMKIGFTWLFIILFLRVHPKIVN